MTTSGILARVAAATALLLACSVQAAPCTVLLANTNPDGSLTSATDCDIASPSASNPTQTGIALNADNPGGLGLSWTFIDRDPGGEGTDAAFGFTGTTSGNWMINEDVVSGNRFVVTMKDGQPLQNDFLWFLIDTSAGANACSAAQTAAGWELCGTWQMYGEVKNGVPTAKNVSHMDLFAANGGNTIQQIPAPATPLLVVLGVMGLLLSQKRRQLR